MLEKNRKWFVLLATGLMIMLVNLDMTIVNLALPDISKSLNADMNQTQWVITSYLLATVLFFTVFGRLADMLGRKKIFLLGISFFTIGSLLAGISSNIPVLMIGRFIQGLGFAATLGLSFVIIFSNFPPEQRGLASGLGVAISGISQAIGPSLGGIIIQNFSWQWIFLINVPLGLLSFVFTSWITPNDKTVKENAKINKYNAVFFVLGLGIILCVLNEWNELNRSGFIGYLAMGIIVIGLFGYSTFKVKSPLINVVLLKNKDFFLLAILRCFFMMLFSSALFVIPLYLQNILNYTPIKTGVMMLSMTVVVAIISPVAGKLMDRIGFATLVIISMVLALIAAALSLLFTADGALLPLYSGLAVLGLAIGLHVPSTIAGVNKEVHHEDAGTAMGLFFTMAITGAIIGVALAGNFLSSASKKYLNSKLSGAEIPSDFLLQVASGSRNITILPDSLQHLAAQAFMYAYHSFMCLMVLFMTISIFLFVFIKTRKSVKFFDGATNETAKPKTAHN